MDFTDKAIDDYDKTLSINTNARKAKLTLRLYKSYTRLKECSVYPKETDEISIFTKYRNVMKTYIWSFPTRIFHWFLFFGFLFAYFSGDFEYYKNIHYAFGAFAGTLILFRFIFGFIGPKYSRFRDFPFGLKPVWQFLVHPFSKDKQYAGHNPLASLITMLILIDGLLTGITGMLNYIALHPVLSLTLDADSMKLWHKEFAKILMVLFGLHLLGVLVELIFRGKTGAFASIFTGYKNMQAEECHLSSFQKVYALFWLVLPYVAFYLAFGLPN